MRLLFRSLIASLTLLATLSCAITASAAVRYAEVGGSGPAGVGECLSSDPCSFNGAITNSSLVDGDEVVLAAGTYDLGSTSNYIQKAIYLHGTGAAKDTILNGTGSFPLYFNQSGTVRGLTVNQTATGGTALTLSSGAAGDQVIATSAIGNACEIDYGTLTNAVCTTAGANQGAVFSNIGPGSFLMTLRNVTAIGLATGANAIYIGASGSTQTVNATNVIAQSFGTWNIQLDSGSATDSHITYNTNHSSYLGTQTREFHTGTGNTADLVEDSPDTNQTDPANQAIFVDPPVLANPGDPADTVFDLHEAPSSPTINAGSSAGMSGKKDIDGENRVQGSAADIGADEFTEATPIVNPPAVTAPLPLTQIDSTAPQTSFKKKPKKKSSARKSKFVFTADDPTATFLCKLDKGRFKICKSSFSKKVKPGKHKLSVVAVDAAGNKDATPAVFSWRVEKP